MKSKHILVGILLLQTGCAHHAYKPQMVTIKRNHTLVLHESRVAMENAYQVSWVKIPDKSNKKDRGAYLGFFNPQTNTSHCYIPWPEKCMLHEYKHQLVKYGLIVPDDPHFNK